MKPTHPEIEQLLRAAPVPRPPEGLQETLMPNTPEPPRNTPVLPPRPNGFPLRRWWPLFTTAGVAIAGLALVTVQQRELKALRQEVAALAAAQAEAQTAAVRNASAAPATSAGAPGSAQDLERLRSTAQTLSTDVAALEALQAESQRLRQQVASRSTLTPEEVQPMLAARDKARSISCVNNLKQLGLAARIWSTDNGDVLPPDLLSMSNEISAPKILICPAEEGRQPAADWSVFTLANTSYEFLAPSGSETEPTRVMYRCPVHGHVCLADGSVQQSLAKTHPEWFTTRDGKLFLEQGGPISAPAKTGMDPAMAARYGLTPPPPGSGPGQPPSAGPQMSEELMRRYGLRPPNDPGTSTPTPVPASP